MFNLKNITLCVIFTLLFCKGYAQSVPQAPNCDVPTLVANAKVLYEESAILFLEFEKVDWTSEHALYLSDIDGSNEKALFTTNQVLVIKDLQRDKEYKLRIWDHCSNKAELMTFDTKVKREDAIVPSRRLYNLTVEWARAKNKDLYAILMEDKTVSLYEKAAFMQQFYAGGEPFPEMYIPPVVPTNTALIKMLASMIIDNDPDPTSPPSGLAANCACRTVMLQFAETVGHLVNDNGMQGNYYPQIESVDYNDHAYNSFWNSWVNRWRRSTISGPSKYIQYYQNGQGYQSQPRTWNIGSSTAPINNGENLTSSVTYASLRYNQMCLEINTGLPSVCGCEKKVNIGYRYDSQVSTDAHKNPGLLSTGAAAHAEDNAVVQCWNDINHVNIGTWAAGHIGAEGQCNTELNPEYWVKVVDLAVSGALVYVSAATTGGTTSPSATQILTAVNSQSSTITGKITALFTTPFYSDQTCSAIDRDGSLFEGQKQIILSANTPVTVTLLSHSSLGVTGFSSWYSSARVLSDYYLAGVMEADIGNGEAGNACCSKNIANWVFGSENPTFPKETVRRAMGGFIGLYPSWDFPTYGTGQTLVPTDYGYRAGLTNVSCQQRIGRNRVKPVSASNLEIRQNDVGSFIYQTSTPVTYTYEVFNTAGALIASGSSNSNIEYPLSTIEAKGVYFVYVHIGEGTSIFKFIK
jgi:hypothetical protein